jgi:hypothetical protein
MKIVTVGGILLFHILIKYNKQDVLYKGNSLLPLFSLVSHGPSLHLARLVPSSEPQAHAACAKFLASPLNIMKMVFIEQQGALT